FILLARYTGQYDLVIGCPVSGRDHPDTEDIMGVFINVLPIRITSDPQVLAGDLVQQVKRLCLEGYSNQTYPFEELVGNLDLDRSLNRNPLFDVLITLFEDTSGSSRGIRRASRKSSYSKYDLSLYVEQGNDGMKMILEYDA